MTATSSLPERGPSQARLHGEIKKILRLVIRYKLLYTILYITLVVCCCLLSICKTY